MAWVLEDQANSGGIQNGITTVSVTFAGTPANDELILLGFVSDSGCTTNVPSGFTRFVNSTTLGITLCWFWKKASGESGATYTVTMTSTGNCVLRGAVWSGQDLTTPIDVVGTIVDDSNTITGVTTTTTACMAISGSGSRDTYTGAPPATWTKFTDDTNDRNSFAYKEFAAAGATGNAVWTSFFPFGVGIMFALRPAGGAPPANLRRYSLTTLGVG